MISVLICDSNRQECSTIGKDCKDKVAVMSNDALALSCLPDDQSLTREAESGNPVHLLYYDFCGVKNTDGLRTVKKQCGDVMVMLITDVTVSPLAYLRPGIAPDSLLLRPIQQKQLDEANQEFVQAYFERRQTDNEQDSFLVETRSEKTMVPYANIYYFEAREKRVFLRTRHEEYAFYGTIDALEKSLPGYFLRCHRSYIVNRKKLLRVMTSEGCLELADQLTVPVSRNYRSALKEALL